MSDELFPKRTLAELDVDARRELPSEALRVASEIVDDVRRRGEPALREHAERLGDRAPGEPLVLERESLHQALDDLSPDDRTRLESVAVRIRTFAQAQLLARSETAAPIPGGVAGTRSVPVQRAGCHAPGGRHPLPSSVLMTAIPARVAGVEEVWVASPRPAPITLAAAALADVDGVLAVGGAQAIAALAHGVVVPQADVIVGPGSHWVTAAKQLVAGRVGIDMLAGPSELVVVADRDADPEWIAADLLAQAEHDPAAWPLLVSLDEGLVVDVRAALERQLVDLPTAEVAREAHRRPRRPRPGFRPRSRRRWRALRVRPRPWVGRRAGA
ncbi:MAG: histidinol dehydrogenase, partial [Acidobacteriota bacterium]